MSRHVVPLTVHLAARVVAALAVAGIGSLAWAGFVPGGGPQESDCYAELYVRGIDDSGAQVRDSRIVSCVDGDACDGDGRCGNDACDISVAVCVSRTDPNLPACTPATLRRLAGRARRLGTPGQDSKPDLERQSSLLQSTFPVEQQSGTSCGRPGGLTVQVRVTRSGRRLPGMLALSLDATAERGASPPRDRDKIVLQCLPRTGECPGATTSTTTTLPSISTTPTVIVGADGIHYDPQTVRIRANDTVRWLWAGSGYSVVSRSTGGAAFCSPSDENCADAPYSLSGSIYEHTFSDVGTFPYFSDASFPLQGWVIVDP